MHGTSAGSPAPLSTFGGLVTLASPDSLPEGASPRLQDVDFIVGQVGTRDGLTSQYSYAGVSAGPDPASIAVGPAWISPGNILINDGLYTSIAAGTTTGNLDVKAFAFSLPLNVSITGIQVVLTGYSNSNTQITSQLLANGIPVGVAKTATLPSVNGPTTIGALGDLWGASLVYSDVNNTQFGIRITAASAFPLATAFLDYVTLQVGITTANANFNYVTTFVSQKGNVKNLSLDASGNLWVEDVTNNPGILNLALAGITPNSFSNGVNGPDVEYMAFNDLVTGSDIPRQYTPNWIDKVTQVGPGQAPVFSCISASATNYAISTITQPVAQTRGYSYFLQSTGPGSGSPGNVVTVYYSDSTGAGPDTDLVAAYNSGFATYVYTSFTGGPATQGPYTQLVTSVGLGSPPGQPRPFYYYTYVLPTIAYTLYSGSGHVGYSANYQRSLATMTTTVPVPGVTVGNVITITATSIAAYIGTWPISQTINSGAVAITSTSVTAGVATYGYSVLSGVAPSAGQLITVNGTLNAGAALNVVNTSIASSTGGGSGTFTIFVSSPDFVSAVETGQGSTAGTIFAFDPGFPLVGSAGNPIFGNSAGGAITFAGNGQFIAPGTKQGSMFWITRNGLWTFPAPPVTFSVPNNTISILASQMLIGPPNVIARGIIITESGANGVPGGNFFTIPTPVKYTVLNVKYVATSLIVNDNTSTTATFTFTDSVLLSALAVDVQGNNLFNLIEIGNPGWIVKYDSRNFYGLCQNKVQNFNNLSFDGGYLPGGQLIPSGWTISDVYGTLINSPVFGNSYYIKNTSGATQATLGIISQTAYQDAYFQPIVNVNTGYSVRVTARAPSGNPAGSLVVTLTSGATTYGTYTLPFASMTSTMAIYSGTLLTSKFLTVPAGLTLNVFASGVANGADVELDRIEVFDTAIPVLTTTVFGSYANRPESVDSVTGQVQFISENQQPVNGAVVMYDTFYGLKESSMYALKNVSNLEPAQWDEPEVAQRVGACGVNAYDFGEQWILEACRNGLYLYEGGLPGKITQEIFQLWNAINWSAKKSIWVRNDVKQRRLFVGVPLPTPNFWLPNAPVNANPTTPNVILMCNYMGIETGEGLKSESGMSVTMFGNLKTVDMRRKWSIWNIPSPYAAFVKTSTDEAFYICNGKANSKVYALDPLSPTDDGIAINAVYTTYGFVGSQNVAQFPMLGTFRKRWAYMTHITDGIGNLRIRLLPNELLGPNDSTMGYRSFDVPGGFNLTPVCLNDREASLNFVATRTYVEFSGTDFRTSEMTLYGKKDTWNTLTGQK